MNRTLIVIASATLIAASAPAHAGMKSKDQSISAQARTSLQRIEQSSAKLPDVAQTLKLKAEDTQHDRESQLGGLIALRETVNQIGSDLKTLEAERGSLEAWEAKALDQVVPLMHEVATDVTRAIDMYNSEGNHLWASSYSTSMSEISKDAERVSSILKEHLQLTRAREKERKLEHELGTPAGM